jgi:hypothetical protein
MTRRLTHPDSLHLQAAEGWLELNCHLEANEELDKIAPQFRVHPHVLTLRWKVYKKENKWDACRDIAAAIIQSEPNDVCGWIALAYATRRAMGYGLKAAQTILISIAKNFPKDSTIPYNLACYDAQLGNLAAARQWLDRAFQVGEKQSLQKFIMDDSDLEPLRKEYHL